MPPLTFHNNYSHLFLEAATKLGINYQIILPTGLIKFTKGNKTFRIFKTQINHNNAVSTAICKSKYSTNLLLAQHGLPVPKQYFCQTASDAKNAFIELGSPMIIKPNNGRQGRHVFFIHEEGQIAPAFTNIKRIDDFPVAEAFCAGIDHRFLVLNSQVIGIVKRQPPQIIGDGTNTIRTLIKQTSHAPLDTHTKQVIAKQGYNLDDILAKNKTIFVRHTANFSTGGTAETIKNSDIHPDLSNLAIEATQAIGISFCGVDMLIQDSQKSRENNAKITELNAQPGIMMHHFPTKGDSQPIAEIILKNL